MGDRPFSYANQAAWNGIGPGGPLEKAHALFLADSSGIVGMRHLCAAINKVKLSENIDISARGNTSVLIYAYVVHLQQLDVEGNVRKRENAKKREIAKQVITAAADKNDSLLGFLFPKKYKDIAGLHGVVALSGFDIARGTLNVEFEIAQQRTLGVCLSFVKNGKDAMHTALDRIANEKLTVNRKINTVEAFERCKQVFLGYITSEITSEQLVNAIKLVDSMCTPDLQWFTPADFKKYDLNLYRRVVVPENEDCAKILKERTAGGALELSPQDKARMDRDIWNKRAMEMVCTRFGIAFV